MSLRERQRGRRGRQGRGEVGDVENQQVEKGSANIHPIVSQTDAGTGPEIEGASTKYFVGTEVWKNSTHHTYIYIKNLNKRAALIS